MGRQGDEAAFEEVFLRYHTELCHFAAQYVHSTDAARDVVQGVFLRFWERRETIDIYSSPRSYLYRAVRNHAINVSKRENRSVSLSEEAVMSMSHESVADRVVVWDLERRLDEAIRLLPERQRIAFTLHRMHDLSYNEIAKVLGIAQKTVENHIGRALVTLRTLLNESS